jgi:hypothetical protein
MANGTDHDVDIVAWATENAAAMRASLPRLEAVATATNLPPIDWENVVEEIEELAKSLRRELASRISTILVHLMKLEASPATDPIPGWRATVRRERAEVERLFEDAPSLRPIVPDVVAQEVRRARYMVGDELADFGEAPRIDMARLTYDEHQVFSDWWPPPDRGN